MTNVQEDPTSSICVILLKHKETNGQENSTALVKVIICCSNLYITVTEKYVSNITIKNILTELKVKVGLKSQYDIAHLQHLHEYPYH